LTILYCSTDRLRRGGAPVQNLSHRASFHSCDKNAPSKSGIKQLVDVYDADAEVLEANAWLRIAPSGPTSARPNGGALGFYNASPGVMYYDTTLAKLIIFDGANWRDPVNGNSV
jgi:hypothetical protein